MPRPQSRPYLPGTNAPCVLASERASQPGDERYSAKPAEAGLLGLAEIRLPDLLVVAEALGVVRQRNAAGLEYVAPLCGVERHQGVLLHEEDRRSLLIDLAHDLEDLLDEDRRKAHRGLVEHQQLGPGHQPAADRPLLLLTARQRP